MAAQQVSDYRIALAQVNVTVGDLPGNTQKIIAYLERARAGGANLVAFPELVVTGYPPEDLLLKPSFIAANQAAIEEIAPATGRRDFQGRPEHIGDDLLTV